MKKNPSFNNLTLTVVLSIVHLIAAILAILRLPETVPMHFDMQWVCDGVGSKWNLLLVAVLPFVIGIPMCLFAARKQEQNAKPMSVTALILTLFFCAMFWMFYPTAASGAQIGDPADVQVLGAILPLLYGMLFIVLGNYLPVIQPNQTLGLRISWTLNNSQCWRVTHRFAGKLWVITGLLLCGVALFAVLLHQSGKLWIYIVFFEMLCINIGVPCVYAYMHKDDGTEAAK